jgi:hypothetical protein
MVDFYNILKIGIVLVLFYFIKQMDIPDSYKYLLTIVPTLLLLGTNYVVRAVQFSGKNKPLMLKRKDTVSDKPIIDEYFFESFNSQNNNFLVETQAGGNATLFEQEKPFWIQPSHYFDISNPLNYIALDHLPPLGANYTLEFWLRLTYLSNNAVAAFYAGDDHRLLDISYDEKYLHVHNTKIPLPAAQKWHHLVVMRGQADTLGGTNRRGLLYVNGLFQTYVPNLPNLQDMTKAFLFKYSRRSPPLRYNKKYHDLANAALVRFYSRSLTLDEIQNNFLKDAYTYGLQEENMTTTRTHVQGSHLVLYLDAHSARTPTATGDDDTREVIFKNKKMNSVVLQDIPLQHNWLDNFDFSSSDKKNDKNKNKNKKTKKMLFQYTTTTTKTTSNKNKNKNQTGKPIF